MTTTTHPSPEHLVALAKGLLEGKERGEVESHVALCEECNRQVAEVRADPQLSLTQQALATTPMPTTEQTLGSNTDTPAPLIDHPRYKILSRLGAGGMGVVYKAEHRMMGRTVALKVLNPLTTSKRGAIDRFRREVRLASRLSHPNIVTAYDADEAGGLHFLVMEYVDGVSLDRVVLRRGPLPVAMACHYTRQAALGLQHAFEKGMVHRDIKPHNLMVTRKGQVKVLDFGLACVARGESSDHPVSETAAQMTAPELVLGTPDFLAPEQARNSTRVDVRADLYSLGCTLYFLLTGKPPFGGSSGFEKMIAHIEEPPPDPGQSRKDIPAELTVLLRKLMAKDPNKRFQTPAEVAQALLPFTKPSPEPAPVRSLIAAPPPHASAPIAPKPTLVPIVLAQPVTRIEPKSKPKPILENSDWEVIVNDEPSATQDESPPPRRRKNRKRNSKFFKTYRSAIISCAVGLAVVFTAGIVAARVNRDRAASNPPATSKPTHNAPNNSNRATHTAPPAISHAPQVLIVLPNRVLRVEYFSVRDALEKGGATVRTASISGGPVDSVPADLCLSKVDPNPFDAVVFLGTGIEAFEPGGSSAPDVRRVLDNMRDRKKIVAGIGLGMKVLWEHNYLEGKRTALPRTKNPWRAPSTVTDQFTITATDERDAKDFAEAILIAMRK